MNSPALGVRITVVEESGVFLGEVWAHDRSGTLSWRVAQRGYSGQANIADENITWCRGWHAGDSDEVKAMKVARALGPEKAIDLKLAQDHYIAGTMSKETWLRNLDLLEQAWDAEFAAESER